MVDVKDNILKFFQRIGENHSADFYLVGGCVRDSFLGLESSDYDIVCRGLPQDVLMNVLWSYGHVEKTGADFGVIRFFPYRQLSSLGNLDGIDLNALPGMFEISLPRKEISVGYGHKDFEVEFDCTLSIADDIGRRDFTVNAMAERVGDGVIYANENSKADLDAKILRMLHDGSAKEDPLRILRGVRFISKLGFTVEENTDRIMREAVPLLEFVSGERIQEELLKLIVGPHVGDALRYMQEIGALEVIIPELEDCVGVAQNHYHSFDVWEHIVKVVENTPSTDPYVRLAALFHDVAKPPTKWIGPDGVAHFYDPEPGQEFQVAPQVPGNHEDVGASMAYRIMGRLRFSESHSKRVAGLVRNHMFIQGENLRKQAARKLLARLDVLPGDLRENVDALFAIRTGDIHGGKVADNNYLEMNKKFYDVVVGELDKKSAFSAKDLAINGSDLMSMGIPQGPEIGKILKRLLEEVIEDPGMNTREYLLEAARETAEPLN